MESRSRCKSLFKIKCPIKVRSIGGKVAEGWSRGLRHCTCNSFSTLVHAPLWNIVFYFIEKMYSYLLNCFLLRLTHGWAAFPRANLKWKCLKDKIKVICCLLFIIVIIMPTNDYLWYDTTVGQCCKFWSRYKILLRKWNLYPDSENSALNRMRMPLWE